MLFSFIHPEMSKLFTEIKTLQSLLFTYIHVFFFFLPSGAPLTQNTQRCKSSLSLTHSYFHMYAHTHTQAHTNTSTKTSIKRRARLKRGLHHYTGITKRNILIKLCRQLQTARRENGNDVVHQVLKEKKYQDYQHVEDMQSLKQKQC